MIYLSTPSLHDCHGLICQILPKLTLILDLLVESICSSELTSLLTCYGTAGRMDLPTPQLLLKLNLVGLLQVVLNLRTTVLIKSPYTTYLSLLEMIYCANFCKSRKVLGLIPVSPLRNVWSCNTSRIIIVAPWREDSLSPFPRNQTHHC